ncbi:tyrosine-type recombinase/integrase [Stutzerimonas marianensis]
MRKPSTSDKGDLRRLAQAIVDRPLKESTIAEYTRVAARMGEMHWHEYALNQRLCRRTAVVARYAWRRNMAHRLLRVLRKIEQEHDIDKRRSLRHEMALCAQQLYAPQPSYQLDVSIKAKKQSKRSSLNGLPTDWRVLLLTKLKSADRLAAAVLILTGCRPAELRKGVRMRRLGEFLEFTIQGAKVSDLTGAGQPERTLLINANAILGEVIHAQLLQKLSAAGNEMVIQDTGQNRAFEKRLTRAATRAGLLGISAYSLRHQFSADLKGEVDTDQVSLALGHVSRKSRKHYGHAKQRRSGAGGILVSVNADRELRGIAGGYGHGLDAPAPKFDGFEWGFE